MSSNIKQLTINAVKCHYIDVLVDLIAHKGTYDEIDEFILDYAYIRNELERKLEC